MTLNLYDILQSVLNESVGQDSVIDAINNKRIIEITYDDEKENPPLGKRWIEPFSLVDMNGGKFGIRAYAYNGATRRGVPKWKLFRLDRIKSWTPTNSTFSAPPDNQYNENGDRQYRVIAQVKFSDEDKALQRNLNFSTNQNKNMNVDSFGRYIQKPQKNQSGPVNNPTVNSVNQQNQGPVETQAMKDAKKRAWKNKNNLEYMRKKREQERAEKLRKQAFGDEEEEMMANFDNGSFFGNNNF